MHDDEIVEYSVNLKEKEVIIYTYNNAEKKQRKIQFWEVLTHSFQCIIDCNIILDIYEDEISSFVNDNQEELTKMSGYCWPIDYQTEQELTDFLITNKYKYITINSSYGMSGWVLAKRYQIVE